MSKTLWEQQRETEIIAQMREDLYLRIPSDIRQEMKLKSIDEPNWREVYEDNPEWKKAQKAFIEALKNRKEIEAQIRVNYKQ